MPSITGSIETTGDEQNLVLTRYNAAPIDEVWKNVTNSERLSRWIGHWIGNPEDKTVEFYMTAESEDADPQSVTIDECEAPHRLAVTFPSGVGSWHLWIELTEVDTGTKLQFGQLLDGTTDLGEIGPGWEYYLDRMEYARVGRDVAAIEWHHYFPAQADAYRALALLDN